MKHEGSLPYSQSVSLGSGWGRQPPDMDGSCKHIE